MKGKTNKAARPAVKAKKNAVKKRGVKSAAGNKLVKELSSLIKDIDDEGLRFLIKQAYVLLYNKKVEEQNEGIKKGKKITIEKPPYSDKVSMEIREAEDNSSFIFVINRARKFFTLEEMRKIVNLCHMAADAKDASHRLFTWFKNNRGDVLIDIGIEKSSDPALNTIYTHLIKRYAVKGH